MNRRDFLKTVGVGAGSMAAIGLGGETLSALAAPNTSAEAIAANAAAVDPVWRVLNRVTNGPLPGQVDAVKKIGIQAYLEQQLNPDAIDDKASEARLGDYATLDMTVPELIALGADKGQAVMELDAATVLRAVYSPRQLYEVMVDFWSEHFSIWHEKDTDKMLKTGDDRDVVRKFALGKFRDILGASAKSPAMLIYLDNAQSTAAHPNENYGREIMELHTITAHNYTEADVKDVSRCFTGWTIQKGKDANPGEFIFNPKMHDNGAKTVLGHTIAAGGGQQDAETVLDILAAHPGTALHVSSKLARRFIGDDPPESVVNAAQAAFLQSGGDIKTVLRVIFAAPEFLNAPPKFKRPWEYVTSLFRAMNAQIDKLNPSVLGILNNLGQLPFGHITPDGYTDYASLWEGNLITRWNATINLVYNKIPNVKVDLTGLVKSQNVAIEPNAVIQFFGLHLYGRALTQTETDALTAFMNKGGVPDLTTDAGRKRVNDTIALMLAAPAFQFR